MKIIIKLGGSILFDGDNIKIDLIRQWLDVIKNLRTDGHQVGIVTGGGKPARRFCTVARKLGATNSYQDLIGIEAARQNARLFIAGLPDAYPDPPTTYQELLRVSSAHNLVVTGGFQPGQSTNGVAALFAEHIEADYLFNISNVSKVYDKDPSKFDDAIPFDEMTYHQFASILNKYEQLPGTYKLFDHIGVDIVSRSKIKLVFLNGNNPEYISDVLNGKSRGTIIQ